MPPANQELQVATKGQRPAVRRWFSLSRPWRLGLLMVILALLIWQRQLWWPLPFEELARRELDRRRPEAALEWLGYVGGWVRPDPDCEILKARAYRRLGDMQRVEEALTTARKAGASRTAIEREQVLAMAQSGQLRQSEPLLPRLLTDVRGDNREVCEAFVIGYIRTQRVSQAAQLLETWISDSPNDPQPLFMRGQIHAIGGNTADAQKYYRRAADLAPNRCDIRLELADVLRTENRPEEAVTLYEQSLTDPEFGVRAMIGLATCKKASGDSTRAIELLQRAVALQPEHPDAERELGRLQFESGNYAEAIRHLQSAIDRTPYDDECHYLLAQALQLGGSPDEARTHFEYVKEARAALAEVKSLKDTIQLNPRNVAALVRAGELLLRYAPPEEGVVQLMAALDIEPENREALTLLADHYNQRAKTEPRFRDLAERFQRRLDSAG
jgi:tetratricopeptide (TPR) repeat protein